MQYSQDYPSRTKGHGEKCSPRTLLQNRSHTNFKFKQTTATQVCAQHDRRDKDRLPLGNLRQADELQSISGKEEQAKRNIGHKQQECTCILLTIRMLIGINHKHLRYL